MLNEERITYRMVNLIESGFFGKGKYLLTEAFADGDKVRIFQAAYNYTYNQNIGVDGLKGPQTNAAIDAVKKDLGKDKLDDTNTADFYYKFLERLQNDKSINIGQGGSNNNRNLNLAIQVLLNLAGQRTAIDGNISPKTNDIIKTLAKADTITSQNILPIINLANPNVKTLGVEGIATFQGDAAAKDNTAKGKVVRYGTCLEGDCENGKGKLLNNNKDGGNNNTYIGTFVNGKLTGEKNRIEYTNGDVFEGKTLNGYPVNGKLTYKSGTTFVGTFYEGSKLRASGTYKSNEGWTYIGWFNREGKMEGVGSTYINKQGQKFVGDFKASSPVGATWADLDSGKATGKFQMTQASDVTFGNDMQKFKSIIDKKIADGTITGKGNIFSGLFMKVGNGLQILDNNNKLLFTTTSIPTKLQETQGRWSYYTGGGGQKLMNFATMNNMTKYVYNYPKDASNSNKAATSNTPPTTSSKETLSKFNIDMKKLLGIIKDYQNKWGFFYKEGTTIKFYDFKDDKKIFTSSVTPEILSLQGGWWVYKDNKIEFKSKNTGKVDYIFTIS